MFKILGKWENIGGASNPIKGPTGLCVYLFYPNLFPFQINIISPKKQP